MTQKQFAGNILIFLFVKSILAASVKSGDIPEPPDCGKSAGEVNFVSQTAEINDFPWAAIFEYETPEGHRLHCVGSLINKRYVLTAASCVGEFFLSINQIKKVRLGEHNILEEKDCWNGICSGSVIQADIENIKVYDDFDEEDPHTNNIALIRLTKDVEFNDNVSPVCLPANVPGYGESQTGDKLIVAGWGHTSFTGKFHEFKQQVVVPLVDHKQCSKNYNNWLVEIGENDLCAGAESQPDACQGFRGAPLMKLVGDTWVIEGISSYGITCNSGSMPNVYTRVSSYQDWIRKNIKS